MMEELLAVPISQAEGEAIVRHTLIPLPDTDSKTAIRNAERKQGELLATWKHSDNLNDVRDTGWGLINAVAEWNEWTGSHVARRKLSPMERLINDTGNEIVVKAKEMVLA